MANRIKGITVEIGGDTTKLQTALKGVNSEIKNTQSQLKDVERLLKLDPGNTELLSQKYKTLQNEIQATKEKLNTLKEASKQADQALKDGTISQEQYDALQREIAETEQSLKSLEQEYKNFGSVQAQQVAAAGEKMKEFGGKVESAGKSMTTHAWSGVVTAADGKTYPFEQKDIVSGSGTLTRSCSGDKDLELGSVYASELDISLFTSVDRYTLYGGSITLAFTLTLADGSAETVPVGVFTIWEATRTSNVLNIKAYDTMLSFDKNIGAVNGLSRTPYQWLLLICTACRVPLGMTEAQVSALTNGSRTFTLWLSDAYSPNDFTITNTPQVVTATNFEIKTDMSKGDINFTAYYVLSAAAIITAVVYLDERVHYTLKEWHASGDGVLTITSPFSIERGDDGIHECRVELSCVDAERPGDLPIASAETLGGVKVGSGLSITQDGTLSAEGSSYVLPVATAQTLGGIMVGDGLAISNGVLRVSFPNADMEEY